MLYLLLRHVFICFARSSRPGVFNQWVATDFLVGRGRWVLNYLSNEYSLIKHLHKLTTLGLGVSIEFQSNLVVVSV